MGNETHRNHIRIFKNESDAIEHMVIKNRASRNGSLFVIVDHPDDQYAIMDVRSAIENEFAYEWMA